MYGAKTWIIRKEEKIKLEAFKMWVKLRIYGIA